MTDRRNRTAEALNWFLRLPLLGVYELAMLMDEEEDYSRRLVSSLREDGWLDCDIASSPEVEPDRLYFLSQEGVWRIAAALGWPPSALVAAAPASEADVTRCWERLEITVGLNRFLAELVAAVRRSSWLDVASIQALPRMRGASAWWPESVEGYVCLQAGDHYAPFFVAWDRGLAPVFHRKKRVGTWYDFRRSGSFWGYEGQPTVAVLSANPAAARHWEIAALSSAYKRDEPILSLLITEIDTAFSADPLDAIWREPGSKSPSRLAERLHWRQRAPSETWLPRLDALPARTYSGRAPALWEPGATSRRMSVPSYRLLGVSELQALDWLAFHPLLTAVELASLMNLRVYQVDDTLERLTAHSLVRSEYRRGAADARDDNYYYLSREGLEVLAARNGIPARRLARYGSIAADVPGWKGAGRFATLLREFDHTVGVNRFFVSLFSADHHLQWRVIRWFGASDSATSFSRHGATHWLRPDGVADIQTPAGVTRMMLEWDRGTIHLGVLREKWQVYAEYFGSLVAAGVSAEAMPRLLVVTTTSQREQRIWEMIAASFDGERVPAGLCATTLIPLVDRYGPWSCIWRSGVSDERHSITPDGTVFGNDRPRVALTVKGTMPSARSPWP